MSSIGTHEATEGHARVPDILLYYNKDLTSDHALDICIPRLLQSGDYASCVQLLGR